MAFTRIVDGLPTYHDIHTHLIPAIDAFLQANGWTREHYNVTSSTDWRLVMSKGGVFLDIQEYNASYIQFNCGHGWDGSNLLGSSYWSTTYSNIYIGSHQLTRNPHEIYLITHGSNFTLLCLPDKDRYASTGYTGTIGMLGMCEKFGTYSGGRFVLRSTGNDPFAWTHQYNSFQIGDVGNMGTAPYMWSQGGYTTNWKVHISSESYTRNTIGRSVPASFATPLRPCYIIAADTDEGVIRPVGTAPDILVCNTLQTHLSGNVIDHLGKQWLCYNHGAGSGISRRDYVHALFKLD